LTRAAGQKAPIKLKGIWAIHLRLQMDANSGGMGCSCSLAMQMADRAA
jgi:hypothetical protein